MQLPIPFADYTRSLLGADEYNRLAEALLHTEPPVSIRLNPLKRKQGSLSPVLPALSDKIPWASDAFYLDERPAFTFDPLFHAGCYYVQEASSMFV